MQKRSFDDIIERVEDVRKQLGLNKSQFSRRIGLNPQTYNNFIGVQGSKPNIALVVGVVDTFHVNPLWLLNGIGNPFSSEGPPYRPAASKLGSNPSPNESTPDVPVDQIGALRVELERLLGPYRGGATPVLHQDALHHQQVQMAVQMLTHLFQLSPVSTTARVIEMLEDFQRIAGEMELRQRNPGHGLPGSTPT